MVCLYQLENDRARSKAGMDNSNVIVNPKVLRKALLKIYYVKDVNIIMKAFCSCDMVEPEPKKTKISNNVYIVKGAKLDDIQCIGERPIGKS